MPLVSCIRTVGCLYPRLLNECHRRLIQGGRSADKQPCEIRRSLNWIGGSRPSNAVFVPQPPGQVADLLGNLERYIHCGDVLLLEHWQLLSSPILLYISGYLKERQSDYYQHLESVRILGDWVAWFEFFLTGIEEVAADAAGRASQLHCRVTEDRQMLPAMDAVTVSTIRLFEQLPDHLVISVSLVTPLLKTTKPTAGKAIEILQRAGIINKVGELKRDRLYSYEPYIDLLT